MYTTAMRFTILALAAHGTVATAQSLAGPNCYGCFAASTGTCLLDTDADTCELDVSQCSTAHPGSVPTTNSMDVWPKGCLAELAAPGENCMGLLTKHDCNGGAEISHNFTDCVSKAKARGSLFFGFAAPEILPPGEHALNCLITNGPFNAGCAGCEGCEYWAYYKLSTMEEKYSCSRPTSTWSCATGSGGNKFCEPNTKSALNITGCEASCGPGKE